MENSDNSTGTVGKPMTGLEVKLVDWEEGSYRTSDKPRPRGNLKIPLIFSSSYSCSDTVPLNVIVNILIITDYLTVVIGYFDSF